jgi:hypothetical protein
MAARLSALRPGRTLPPGFFIFKDSWYSFPLEAESTARPVRPEELGQFKKSTSSGLEPVTFQLAAYCLNHYARVHNFHFSTSSIPALGSTQPPIQWVPGALSPGVKWSGREADHSLPASAEVKKMWIYTSTPPYAFMA